MNYSVLLPVYIKEKPEYLRESIQSVLEQTVPPSDFVIVCDGPLTKELDQVIQTIDQSHPGLFQIVRLEKNQGLGMALNIGMQHCKCSLVARMDSDDIALPYRCALQLEIFEKIDVDFVSGTVGEFNIEPQDITQYRVLPETYKEILVYAKKRNPINHPCVMFRKERVLQAGNYQPFAFFEDYHLWLRMLQNGCKAYNIPQTILWMRVDKHTYYRRGGWAYFKITVRFLNYMRGIHYCNNWEYIQILFLRGIVAIVPNTLRSKIYRKFLR